MKRQTHGRPLGVAERAGTDSYQTRLRSYLGDETASRRTSKVAQPTIIYTHTDEAPALATYSFLPVIQAFASAAGVNVEIRDISLAGRIIATFPDHLEPGQRIGDALA
ncbi:MAG: NADP-dependent isocitrate dehydrogenase, partial [Acidimicrobiales bacterium]